MVEITTDLLPKIYNLLSHSLRITAILAQIPTIARPMVQKLMKDKGYYEFLLNIVAALDFVQASEAFVNFTLSFRITKTLIERQHEEVKLPTAKKGFKLIHDETLTAETELMAWAVQYTQPLLQAKDTVEVRLRLISALFMYFKNRINSFSVLLSEDDFVPKSFRKAFDKAVSTS